jgi:hypothetical protein
MVTQIKPDNSGEYVDGVDRHFYENQVGASSPFDDTFQFRLAAAIAKDQARHQLIRAVRKADDDARANSFTGFGNDSLMDRMSISRSIDGVESANDDKIKL